MTFFHLHADTCGEKYEHIIIVMNHGEWGLRKSDGYEIQYC